MDINQLVTDEPFHCNIACTPQGKAGRFYKELLLEHDKDGMIYTNKRKCDKSNYLLTISI